MPRPKKFEKIEIQFLSLDSAESEVATVLLRGEEMVIDILAADGTTDYLIVGKPVKYFLQGVNSAGVGAPKVRARWALLGRVYVGEWVEDGQEYLFSFELKN